MQTVTHRPDGFRIFHGNGQSAANNIRVVYYQGMVYRTYGPERLFPRRVTYVYRGTDVAAAPDPVQVWSTDKTYRLFTGHKPL